MVDAKHGRARRVQRLRAGDGSGRRRGVTVHCPACGRAADAERVAFRAVCEACGAWLHCCRSCDFHAPGRSNDCREPNAAPVADKAQANFCEWFRPAAVAARAPAADAGARAALDALFRKKPG
jgi:hypothetical protein